MLDSVTNILGSGPSVASLPIAVSEDGVNASDQTTYKDKLNKILIDGMFGHH